MIDHLKTWFGWGWKIHFQAPWRGCWQALVSHWLLAGSFISLQCGPLCRVLMTEWVMRERDGSWHVLCNLISTVIYRPFCHILLVPQTNPGTMWERTTQGCECHWGHLYLFLVPSCIIAFFFFFFTFNDRSIYKKFPKRQNSSMFREVKTTAASGVRVLQERNIELSEVMEMFYNLTWMMVRQVYTYVKIQ